MKGKRKSHAEESPAASSAEESDSAPPARKKPRNGHGNGNISLDEDMEEVALVKPEGMNGSQATNGAHAADDDGNSSAEEEEKDYVDEENEEGQVIRRYKRRLVKLERGSDG